MSNFWQSGMGSKNSRIYIYQYMRLLSAYILADKDYHLQVNEFKKKNHIGCLNVHIMHILTGMSYSRSGATVKKSPPPHFRHNSYYSGCNSFLKVPGNKRKRFISESTPPNKQKPPTDILRMTPSGTCFPTHLSQPLYCSPKINLYKGSLPPELRQRLHIQLLKW